MPDLLGPEELAAALADLPGWEGDPASLRRTVQAPDFASAIRLVDAVAEDAEAMDHHPDMDIRWRKVTFVLSTHSAGGVTANDTELARRIDGHAARLGAV
jgi:4a-hydroxytetrahydrobiopterin dehydratase